MKNKLFSLENFIEFHTKVLHQLPESILVHDYLSQAAYERGWTDCLDALKARMDDDTMSEIFKKMFE